MGEPSKVVARYRDGRVLKGHTHDFSPSKPRFHLFPADGGNGAKSLEVWLNELKAVFFVRTFAGDPNYEERKQLAEGDRAPGRKLAVTFADGEVLVGSSLGYDPQRPGFFLIPLDPGTNNLRIFVPSAAVQQLRPL